MGRSPMDFEDTGPKDLKEKSRIQRESEIPFLAELRARKPGAFESLVQTHAAGIYNLAFKFMGDHGAADDVVQETFVKAFNAIENFRGDSSLKSWLFTIASNTARNALRSRGRTQSSTFDEGDIEIPVTHKEFNRLENLQTGEILKLSIQMLPEKQKMALELRIYEDLSFKEIAEIMQSPFDTAKANFRHAIFNLKKILIEKFPKGSGIEELKLAFDGLGDEDESL